MFTSTSRSQYDLMVIVFGQIDVLYMYRNMKVPESIVVEVYAAQVVSN